MYYERQPRMIIRTTWPKCLEFFVPLETVSLIWKHHHCIAGEGLHIVTYGRHLWFLSVSHLMWHGASVYTGHLGILTRNVEHLAVELPVLTTSWVCRGWDSNTQPSACANAAAFFCVCVLFSKDFMILQMPWIEKITCFSYKNF